MTTVYLIRHSEPLKAINLKNSDPLQLQNEKWPLTVEGEHLALKKSRNKELKDFDIVISSNYVRAIATAKYFTSDKVYIDASFGERKFGINTWDELPIGFEKNQFADFNYKLKDGESLNEVMNREYTSLMSIIDEYKDGKILIVGHSTAFASLLTKWCKRTENGYKFNDKIFFNGIWNHCETFKLKFDNNKSLIKIENIK